MQFHATYRPSRVSGILVLALYASLFFWCGDAVCLSGQGGDACTSILCSVQAGRTGSEFNGSAHGSDHSCVCQAPNVPQSSLSISVFLPIQSLVIELGPTEVSAYTNAPYRPPLAA